MQMKTPTTIAGRIIEYGNGLSHEYACDGCNLYRVIRTTSGTRTTGLRGNWRLADLEPVDWDVVPDGFEPVLSCEIGSF